MSQKQILTSSNAIPFSDGVTGLSSGTTYYYRVAAQNSTGTSRGSILSFVTLPIAPTLQAPTSGVTGLPLTPTLIWNASTGATTYRLQVSSTSLFTTVVFDDSTLTGTSKQIGPLSGSSTYFWRVAAKNSGGWSGYSSMYQFTTLAVVVVPLPPKLSSPADGATKQKPTLTLTWDPSTGASTYRLQVSTAGNFGTMVFDDSTIAATSKQIGPLLSNATYYWRVGAKNSSGFSGYSSAYSFVTELPIPTAPVLNSPSNGASGLSLSAFLSWSAVSDAAGYHLQVSTEASFSGRFVINDSLLTGTSRTLTSIAANTIYYWRVASLNISGKSSFSSTWYFSSLGTVTVTPSTITFPSQPTQSTSYRLIGFPGTTPIYVRDFVSGTNLSDWRMFSDPGSGNFQEITNGNLALSNGEGYWLLRKGDAKLSAGTLSMPPLSSDATYSIKLHSGWNIISNPFDKSVNWDQVKSVNSLSASIPLYDYNGSYFSATTFDPYKGYYFNNTPALNVLKIPYPFPGAKIDVLDPPSINWRIQIAFESDINRDDENYLGIASSARNEYDELDQAKPPLFMDQGFVYFERSEWMSSSLRYSGDYRPAIEEGQRWDFDVSNPRASKGTLRFIGIQSVPAFYEIRLLDKSRQAAIDVRENQFYQWTPTQKISKFSLVVGPKKFVEDQADNILPKVYDLLQNYPNPFNPATTITFRLPKISHVRLEILSLLGERIAALVDQNLPGGAHSYLWDGTDDHGVAAASGIYLYRLMTESGFSQTKKMTLIR
ncbi:MAG: T9SS type A sorting domain-containing protein [bacterium]